jgi:hypothetical protein
MITTNNTKLDLTQLGWPNSLNPGSLAQGSAPAGPAADLQAPKTDALAFVATPAGSAPAPAPLSIQHAAHPFWQGFSWDTVLKTLQTAAAIAPIVVAIVTKNNLSDVTEAAQLGQLAGAILGGAQTPQAGPQ